MENYTGDTVENSTGDTDENSTGDTVENSTADTVENSIGGEKKVLLCFKRQKTAKRKKREWSVEEVSEEPTETGESSGRLDLLSN